MEKKNVKKYKIKIGKKGFTLVELLGVIVILSLVLMIVFPSLFGLMSSNNEKKYENYYDLVYEASRLYAGKLSDKLGTSKDVGCAGFNINDLIKENYIKSYDDKTTTCSVGNIRIDNNKNKVSVKFKLTCKEKDSATTWIKGEEPDISASSCIAYKRVVDSNLKNAFDPDNNKFTYEGTGDIGFVKKEYGETTYAYYSGKLWRIYAYDSTMENIRLISADSVTTIPFNTVKNSTYFGSHVERWLKTDFLSTFKDFNSFAVIAPYYAGGLTDKAKTQTASIGLLSIDEYVKIRAWYNMPDTYWLSTEGSGGNAIYAQNYNYSTAPSHSFKSVRPVITLRSDIGTFKGDGTRDNPFIIDENYAGKKGDLINTRHSGEHVRLYYDGATRLFRIVRVENGKTKLISLSSFGEVMYDDSYYDFNMSNVNDYLNKNTTSIYNKLPQKNLLDVGDFCSDVINEANIQTGSGLFIDSYCLSSTKVKTAYLGLPKVGDIYTIRYSTGPYWTMNPNTVDESIGRNSIMNTMTPTGPGVMPITGKAQTHIVLYLNSKTKIVSGDGSESNPYLVG